MGHGRVTILKLPHVHEYTDRHGRLRRYVRMRGSKRVALKGEPGSAEFMAIYHAALDGRAPTAPASRAQPGTIAALVARYYASGAFAKLRPTTQTTYRGILNRFVAAHGDKRVASLERGHVQRMMDARASTPQAANNWLALLRMTMALAVELGWRGDNPTTGVKSYPDAGDGHPTWEAHHIAAFRARHPIGSRARLAMELLFGTAQRRSDVIRMGRQHVRDGVLSIRQAKTGMQVDVPLLPEVVAAIEATGASDRLTFLVTAHGRPFAPAGFGNWFREQCTLAGLPPRYSAHGLRKAAATRLADAGATETELKAWGGWKTTKEVQRYTERANRKRAAQSAGKKVSHSR